MSSDENDISRTVPRRGLVRETPRIGAVIVVGSGDALDGLRAPRIFAMEQLALDIGRRPHPTPAPTPPETRASTLAIPDSTVSSLHARIQRASTGADLFILQDLGSTNGTYVDGKRSQGPVPLRDGAVLFLGSQVLVFRIVTTAEYEAMQQEAASPFTKLPTCSPSLAVTCAKLGRLARSDSEILLVGETGVGKDVFANAIHAHSGRNGRFVAINCAAIPRELAESELFGYEKGAHSTAQGRKVGLVELANGGTLFLDEIGDMPPELQSKLLRFLQDRRFTPLGSTRVVEADVRIVAATSRVDLQKGAHVQEAVLGRLGAQPIVLPPLHDRVEDIGRLVAHFLGDLKDGRAFEPEAFHALCLHAWPLNVRELSKVIEEAEALSRGAATIGLEHLPDAVTATLQLDGYDDLETTDVDLKPPPDDGDVDGGVESDPGMTRAAAPPVRARRPAPTREELTTLLAETKGSVAEVARRLNRQYAVIWRCVQRYGIDASSFRGGSGGDQ